MRDFVLKYKPHKIIIDFTSNLAYFIKDDRKSKVDFKTPEKIKSLDECLSAWEYTAKEEAQSANEKVFDLDYSLTERPQDNLFGDSPEDVFNNVTEVLNDTNTQTSPVDNLGKILENIDRIAKDGSVLELIVTSSGTLIKDNKVSGQTVSPEIARILYEEYSRGELNAVGDVKSRRHKVGTREYIISMWKIGDEISVKFTRLFHNLTELRLILPTEMKYRYDKIKSGLIVTSINSLINMEYSMPVLKELDKNFMQVTCTVGDNFISTKLPNHDSLDQIEYLANTQYKYIIVSGVNTREHLLKLLNLVYNGKTIILGFESDSAYANLITLLSLCDNNPFSMNKVLMSTIGFIHPIVSLKDDNISLENSECVTLSSSKAMNIINGDLSKEKFNLLIEKSSKVYNLGTQVKTTFMSQEEELNGLLQLAIEKGASDIHLAVGTSPKMRIQGELISIDENLILKPEVLEHITSLFVTTELQKQVLEETNELYMPYSVSGVGRFRVQISTQRGTKYIVIRHTALQVPSAEQMRIPQKVIDAVVSNPKGLVIVTGPTGSGKSTTSAILIDILKKSGSYAITSLADPIEFIHSHGNGIVTQREIPSDVNSFDQGLLSAFRSDPDIIEVSEMRTTESIEATMRFANSGHLVITTYHTSSVIGTFNALMNKYPEDRRDELLNTLAQNTIAIINQTLVEGKNGKRVPIFEYLIPDRLMRRNIAENKLNMIEGSMKTSGRTNQEIATWADYELLGAYEKGEITREVLVKYLRDKNSVKEVIK